MRSPCQLVWTRNAKEALGGRIVNDQSYADDASNFSDSPCHPVLLWQSHQTYPHLSVHVLLFIGLKVLMAIH